MTEQEQKDLERLHIEMGYIRENILSFFSDLKLASLQELEFMGRGTLARETSIKNAKLVAMWDFLQYIENKIKKLTQEHLKKYPD